MAQTADLFVRASGRIFPTIPPQKTVIGWGRWYYSASTPRRKNELHLDGHSRREWLAGHGPLERLSEGAVEVGDEGLDAGLQVLLGGEAGAPQQLAHKDGEPDLDLVQPRGVLGREVKADPVAGITQERLAAGHRGQHAGLALLAEVVVDPAPIGEQADHAV